MVKIFWKIYAILLSLVILLGIITYLVIDKRVLSNWGLLNIPISVISLIGIVAFAFHKALSKALFWKIWFIFFVLWGILFSVFSPQQVFRSKFILVASSIISLPSYIALFLYAYGKSDIWLSQKNKK